MSKRTHKQSVAILDLDDIRNPLLGAGQARATYEVARRLVAMGYKVTVYCCRFPGYKDRVQDGITYRHISLGTRNIRLNNLAYILTAPFYVSRIKADIIIESFVAPVSTLCSPLFTNIPVIGLPSMFNAKEFNKKYFGFPFHLIEKWGSKCYKYFLPYSNVDSQKMRALNPAITYKIVPQGVDKSFFSIPHKTPKHILFLSRFDIRQKGIDLLIEAYAKIADKTPYGLVIAGHGPDRDKIGMLIRKYGLGKRVKLVGPAYGKFKEKLISESAFVAFPSRHDELSLWALEALASGMPLVGFDLPETAWAGSDVCLKAQAFDTDEYAQLLLKASEPGLNAAMRVNARNLAAQYTWENVAGMFSDFIQEVLETESKKALTTVTATRLSYTVNVPRINDEATLCIVEGGNQLPFTMKRLYYIMDVANNLPRGFHAHHETRQMLFCIRGSITVILDNGYEREKIKLNKPNQGVFLDRMMWHEMVNFSKDTVLLVAASDHYREDDYIRDYDRFLALVHGQNRLIDWSFVPAAIRSYVRTSLRRARAFRLNYGSNE